jgi:hypothetical protein
VPRKVGGERRYADVTLKQLKEIAGRYGIEIGIPGAATETLRGDCPDCPDRPVV